MKKHAESHERIGFLISSRKSNREIEGLYTFLVVAVSSERKCNQLSRLTKSMPGSAFVLNQ